MASRGRAWVRNLAHANFSQMHEDTIASGVKGASFAGGLSTRSDAALSSAFGVRPVRRAGPRGRDPLDLPIDELVTWNQLTGEGRLSDALAECDERGWDALPLATKEPCRLFPNLWAIKKATERWLAKDPQRHIEI